MKKYLIKRALYLLALLLCVTFFTFAVTTSVPGGDITGGSSGDASYFFRYTAWLRVILLGQTKGLNLPRNAAFIHFGQLMPGTIRFAGISFFFIVVISLPLGLLCAVKKDSISDYIIRIFSFLGASIPNFILGFLLMFYIAVRYRWFPVIGSAKPRSMVLPVIALTTPLISRYIRHIRGVALEELNREYIVGATARGVHQWRIILFHVIPNALPSMLSFMRISIGQLLSGVVVIETVYVLSGVGSLAVSSVRSYDYPVIQAYVLWMAVLYIATSLVIETITNMTDPLFRRKWIT